MTTQDQIDQLGRDLLEQHLQKLKARISSGEATAADFAVALKTLQEMGVQMKVSTKNAVGQLSKAVTDQLPFAGESPIPPEYRQ